MTPAALLLNGTVGSGKTAVADALGDLLADREIPHAVIDLDWLRRAWPSPPGDPFNHAMTLRNLTAVATNFLAAGAERLVLAGVLFTNEPGYLGLDTYDPLHQILVSHHFHFDDSTDAQLYRSTHRYIWPSEMDLMAQLAGFELESRHADWSGTEFTAESRSHVSVYRLPGEPAG